jgi:hypothetical protein
MAARARCVPVGVAPPASGVMWPALGRAVVGRRQDQMVQITLGSSGIAARWLWWLIEVKSDFRYDRREPPTVEDALTWRAERDRDPAGTGPHGVAAGETEISVQGMQQAVPVTRLGGYSGLQFREESVLVTVVTRNVGADLPPIVKIADLEPFLKARDKISEKDIAAWFAAYRDGSGSEPTLLR